MFLGARSAAKGEAAVKEIADACTDPSIKTNIEYVQIDVCSEESVKAAAETIKAKLEPKKLYAVVNNAGTGFQHGTTPETIIDTNLYGPKRVCEAFLPMICSKMGRIVNVGSGSGPSYVEKVKDRETKRMLCSPDVTLDFILDHAKTAVGSEADAYGGYGLSKALLTCYTMVLAREHPNILCSVLSPGFIKTKMTEGFNASKTPEEGTVAIMHCLFDELDGNGWYYGSDAVRSPLHYMRNPGEPAYDGKNPFD